MSYRDWYSLTDEQVSERDIADVNLACVRGLPGTPDFDSNRCQSVLDDWTEAVQFAVGSALRNRENFPQCGHFSEAEYCILTMYAALYRHLGLTLNTDVLNPAYVFTARESRDTFVHGILQDGYPATSCTAPVIFAAIGRRLGYPIKLVKTSQHLFCRWVGDDGERFNIEATNRGYYRTPDTHYHTWPRPISQRALRKGVFLTDLTPRQELALFLHFRGLCLLWHLRPRDAVVALSAACKLDPSDYYFHNELVIGWMFCSAEEEAKRRHGLYAGPYHWRIPSWCPKWGQSLYRLAVDRLESIIPRNNESSVGCGS